MSTNHFKEIEIEDFIWKNLEVRGELQKRGLRVPGAVFYRQFNIGCGVIDLVSIMIDKTVYNSEESYKRVSICIYELKRRQIVCAHVGQISRYITAVRDNQNEILESLGFDDSYRIDVTGVLIGESIERDAACLAKSIYCLEVFFFGIGMQNGIEFQQFDVDSNVEKVVLPPIKTCFYRFAKASIPVKRHNKVPFQ